MFVFNRKDIFFRFLRKILLTGFLKGDFRQEKGHQQQLWRVCVDGQERSFTGQKPFETAFYFLSYLPE
jgi:hypothetical protein